MSSLQTPKCYASRLICLTMSSFDISFSFLVDIYVIFSQPKLLESFFIHFTGGEIFATSREFYHAVFFWVHLTFIWASHKIEMILTSNFSAKNQHGWNKEDQKGNIHICLYKLLLPCRTYLSYSGSYELFRYSEPFPQWGRWF